MSEIPHDGGIESSLALLADPYGFIGERCRRLGTEVFRTRLLLQTHICMMGRDAAELFYDEERFTRRGALLAVIQLPLMGRGGVQGFDGDAHRHRKQLFTSLITPASAAEMAAITAKHWRNCIPRWKSRPQVVLYEEAREVVCRGVCEWAGVPVEEGEFPALTRELAAMYEFATTLGPRYLWALFARQKRDRWAARLVEDVRSGRLKPADGSALHAVATHRDVTGQLLEPRVAAVELLNLLRPTVATSVWAVFAALALHHYQECREQIERSDNGADGDYAECFAQEVRRFYPFFPAVAARVRSDFEWRGHRFPQHTRVLLGLYATNHDSQLWDSPAAFRPERFRNWDEDPFRFIPQGGGDREQGHRCPGDRISVEQIKAAAKFLVREICYEVPKQDLKLELKKLPALPHSRFVISNVRNAC